MKDSTFWNHYVANLMDAEDRKNYESHKSGTLKLQPFYENAMEDMGHEFLQKVTGEVPMDYKGIGSFNSVNTRQSLLMLDNDTTTFYSSGVEQGNGDWIGVDLRTKRQIKDIFILQGRNRADNDYFKDAILEYSEDKNTWYALTDTLRKQREIRWNETPVPARFVRLRRLDSNRTNFVAIRSFAVNRIMPEDVKVEFNGQPDDAITEAFDRNLNTAFSLDGTLAFKVDSLVKEYVLLTNELNRPVHCSQYDSKGKLISQHKVESSYISIAPLSDAAWIKIDGNIEIFEFIPVYSAYPNKQPKR